MLISYPTDIKNQVLIKKNLKILRFSSDYFQTAQIKSIDSYLSVLTPLQKKIAYYLLQFRNAPWITLRNESIALSLGCSVKTVTRATNKFLEDGFISKYQQNRYAPNSYALNPNIKTSQYSYSHWFNSLSITNQDLYVSHGIRVNNKNKVIFSLRNVPQNKSSLILESIFSNQSPLSRVRTRGKGIKKSKRHKKGVVLVSEFQKKWIMSHKTDPRVKDMLNNPKIKAALITPTIEKLAKLLTLNEDEQLKLVVFSDTALDYGLDYVERVVTGKKVLSKPIHDRVAWLMSALIAHSKGNNLPVDWKWYYDVCEIINKDPQTVSPKRPLNIAAPVLSVYQPWKAPVQEPHDIRLQKLKEQLIKQEAALANSNVLPYMMSYLQRMVTETKREIAELEAEQSHNEEDEYEKQILSNQYRADSVASAIS